MGVGKCVLLSGTQYLLAVFGNFLANQPLVPGNETPYTGPIQGAENLQVPSMVF